MTITSVFAQLLPYCTTLEPFILDDSISEISVNPDRKVFIERNGVTKYSGVSVGIGEAEDFATHAARWLGRDISDRSPLLSTRMADGSRISITCPPISPGWCLTIRKFGDRRFSLHNLQVHQGMMNGSVCEVLREAIIARDNVLISGATGTGKTTVLNALISEFPADERVVLIEDTSEIFCQNENIVRFEAWPGSAEIPAISIRELLKHALRFSPTRLVIGEVRDDAAYDLLQALNTGHNGSFSTVHADSAVQALRRISNLALSAHPNLSHTFIREETANAIDLVLHIRKEDSGLRRVVELISVDGYDTAAQKFDTETIYSFSQGVNK